MQVLEGIEGFARLPHDGVLSVGNFDGIHRGHQRLLERARELKAQQALSTIAAVTFEPHPLTLLRPALAPARLTAPAHKRTLLTAAGVDCLLVLPPTPQTLDMTAEEFWAVLRDQARPRAMVEGGSFNFGKNRGGTIAKLRVWAAQSSVQLHVIDPVDVALLDLSIVPVSSSIVRWLLERGRARDAAICLGRPYALEGPVIEGFRRGRTIGVPTANLQVLDQLVPADGVYAARCAVDGRTYAAALSIGTLPTFGDDARQIEAHLIGFDGDLYGRTLAVEVLDWIRDQRKFQGVEPLVAQLRRDIAEAGAVRDRDVSRPIAQLVAS